MSSHRRFFLLDGMALLYRAHFALIRSPIMTSDGVNTSALFGFANTLLDILNKQEPTHIAVALDTAAPTPRHVMFPDYKAQREEMPEDLAKAIPQMKRLCTAMRIPLLVLDGYEADDIIGTLATQADAAGDETWMVTPDKDFAQLVTEHVKIYKPGRQGSDVERMGIAEVQARWGVERCEQVIDILGLMGDASDNIPGVPGIGEKTAMSIIRDHGSIENAIANAAKIKGKTGEKIRDNAEMALLCKKLATIIRDVPLTVRLDDLARQPYDDDALKALFTEYEMNSLGRRLFGDEFKAGRGRQLAATVEAAAEGQMESAEAVAPAVLKKLAEVPHDYMLIRTVAEREMLIQKLMEVEHFCFDLETTSLDPRYAEIVGIAFCWEAHTGAFVLFESGTQPASQAADLFELASMSQATAVQRKNPLQEFAAVFARKGVEKIGHNLKYDLAVLHELGMRVEGPFFDTMLAHALLEPEQRHGMDFVSEQCLGYTPISITELIGATKGAQLNMATVARDNLALLVDYAVEDADITWQLSEVLRPRLEEKNQHEVFYDLEAPLLPVLMLMESRGVAIDVPALKQFGSVLEREGRELEQKIHGYIDSPFNLNSPKQLGEVLFEKLNLVEKPKKTATGQYQTNEQVLQNLQGLHPIIEEILQYREVTKLKSTYVDALPEAVSAMTQRVHTSLHQLLTATGRIASSDPNLQNIPIRSEHGREIRRAFVPGKPGHVLLSADYSQIELRVMAAMSEDPGMCQAFRDGHDIHEATAAKVYGVGLAEVQPDMRRTAKMVNFGIIYGISAFGLSQRLGIPRGEAGRIIDSYFVQFAGVKQYLERVVEQARERGYVETLIGRRRYLRDITSKNATVRAAAERIAMNAPIQGTAADMIKLAMVRTEAALKQSGYKTQMLLQVHDELLFEVPLEEVDAVKPMIIDCMMNALPLAVPVLVEAGVGHNWLEAH